LYHIRSKIVPYSVRIWYICTIFDRIWYICTIFVFVPNTVQQSAFMSNLKFNIPSPQQLKFKLSNQLFQLMLILLLLWAQYTDDSSETALWCEEKHVFLFRNMYRCYLYKLFPIVFGIRNLFKITKSGTTWPIRRQKA